MQFFFTCLYVFLLAEACQMHCIRANVILQVHPGLNRQRIDNDQSLSSQGGFISIWIVIAGAAVISALICGKDS